jgi:GT2 family glycosyltransferase
LSPAAQLIQLDSNTGFAAANNLAARTVETPFIALLNPDAFPEPDWLAQLLEAAQQRPQFAAYGALQICDEDGTLLDGACDEMHVSGMPYRALYRRSRSRTPPQGEAFSACAAAALYRTATFLSAGGFDESFFCYCEDVDLGYRLRLAGMRTLRVPSAVVRHIGGGAGGGRTDFARYHGFRNRLWCFVKNTPPLLFWCVAPIHAAASSLNALAVSISQRSIAPWRGLIEGLAGLPRVWSMRRAIQKERRVSSFTIARALVWSPFAMLSRSPKLAGARSAPPS